jgi:hypothetical protein
LIWELLGYPLPNDREPISIDLHIAEQAFRGLHYRLRSEIAFGGEGERMSAHALMWAIGPSLPIAVPRDLDRFRSEADQRQISPFGCSCIISQARVRPGGAEPYFSKF